MPRFFLPMVLFIGLATASSSQACPNCAAGLAQSEGGKGRSTAAYNASIVLMAGMPFALTGIYGVTFWRLSRRRLAAQVEERECPPSSRS